MAETSRPWGPPVGDTTKGTPWDEPLHRELRAAGRGHHCNSDKRTRPIVAASPVSHGPPAAGVSHGRALAGRHVCYRPHRFEPYGTAR